MGDGLLRSYYAKKWTGYYPNGKGFEDVRQSYIN